MGCTPPACTLARSSFLRRASTDKQSTKAPMKEWALTTAMSLAHGCSIHPTEKTGRRSEAHLEALSRQHVSLSDHSAETTQQTLHQRLKSNQQPPYTRLMVKGHCRLTLPSHTARRTMSTQPRLHYPANAWSLFQHMRLLLRSHHLESFDVYMQSQIAEEATNVLTSCAVWLGHGALC